MIGRVWARVEGIGPGDRSMQQRLAVSAPFRERVVGACRVCGGGVLASSRWPDLHPACHQWPEGGRRYGPEEKGQEP